ncbi:bacteriophage holin [Legionella fairfieldensis]|uniref:bacteriophage holin n=1 Tax=Legionella fairfieldensis TaxID=45064 RepID=UPI00055AFC83|nr:bacteriophage holin [Legionella fairfieldensis]
MVQCKLHPLALGLALGVIWGISTLLMGLIATYYAYGKTFVAAMGSLYIGYEPSVSGSLIGGLIGFIDAFIGGVLVAWLYNLFAGCCHKKDVRDVDL